MPSEVSCQDLTQNQAVHIARWIAEHLPKQSLITNVFCFTHTFHQYMWVWSPEVGVHLFVSRDYLVGVAGEGSALFTAQTMPHYDLPVTLLWGIQ